MTNAHYLREIQYRDDRNLLARQSLYRFQQPRVRTPEFAFALVDLHGDERVLDIGCGNGAYLATLDRREHSGDIVGLDMSHGMLQAARSWSTAWLAVGDALSLPLRDATFDVVLAMHMLYYVPDRVSGLREMRRVCRPDGVTLVLTNAEAHLHELKEVVRAATELDLPSSMIAFKLENGEPELRQVYDDVERHDAASELVITEVEPVLDYVRSMRGFVERAGNERLLARIARQVADHIERHGAFRVTTHVGCFVCRGAVRPSGAV